MAGATCIVKPTNHDLKQLYQDLNQVRLKFYKKIPEKSKCLAAILCTKWQPKKRRLCIYFLFSDAKTPFLGCHFSG